MFLRRSQPTQPQSSLIGANRITHLLRYPAFSPGVWYQAAGFRDYPHLGVEYLIFQPSIKNISQLPTTKSLTMDAGTTPSKLNSKLRNANPCQVLV